MEECHVMQVIPNSSYNNSMKLLLYNVVYTIEDLKRCFHLRLFVYSSNLVASKNMS